MSQITNGRSLRISRSLRPRHRAKRCGRYGVAFATGVKVMIDRLTVTGVAAVISTAAQSGPWLSATGRTLAGNARANWSNAMDNLDRSIDKWINDTPEERLGWHESTGYEDDVCIEALEIC
jgi:hypothetical protein